MCARSVVRATLFGMLTVYRRHVRRCPHTSRHERRCQCPIAVEGTLNGEVIRKSLGLRSLEAAQKLVREWEVRGSVHETPGMKVREACERFYADCEARKLGTETLGKYKLLVKELKDEFGESIVGQVSVDDLRSYREKWSVASVTARKKLERLRTFFKFCKESGWVHANPAKVLKAPKGHTQPTLPLTKEDFEKLLRGCEAFPCNGIYQEGNRVRVKAFALLLRYSGLRIRDAVLMTEEKLKGNQLFLYSQKTGVPVYVPLPDFVIKELYKANKLRPGKYVFWSGEGKVKSCVNDWQRTLSRLAALSGVKFHAHMLRDTFAVALLEKGVSLENVATLLGNSVKVCEKHYSPWVKSRQDALTNEIKKAWKLS